LKGQLVSNEVSERATYIGALTLICILGAILFGIAHDLVTAHVAVEHFTVYHPRLIESESPIAMALLWGVLATWWMGLIFGLIMGVVGVVGHQPRLPLRRVARALTIGLLVVLALSMMVLVGSYVVIVTMDFAPGAERAELVAVRLTHMASYLFAAGLGIILCLWIARTRRAIDPAMPAWVER